MFYYVILFVYTLSNVACCAECSPASLHQNPAHEREGLNNLPCLREIRSILCDQKDFTETRRLYWKQDTSEDCAQNCFSTLTEARTSDAGCSGASASGPSLLVVGSLLNALPLTGMPEMEVLFNAICRKSKCKLLWKNHSLATGGGKKSLLLSLRDLSDSMYSLVPMATCLYCLGQINQSSYTHFAYAEKLLQRKIRDLQNNLLPVMSEAATQKSDLGYWSHLWEEGLSKHIQSRCAQVIINWASLTWLAPQASSHIAEILTGGKNTPFSRILSKIFCIFYESGYSELFGRLLVISQVDPSQDVKTRLLELSDGVEAIWKALARLTTDDAFDQKAILSKEVGDTHSFLKTQDMISHDLSPLRRFKDINQIEAFFIGLALKSCALHDKFPKDRASVEKFLQEVPYGSQIVTTPPDKQKVI